MATRKELFEEFEKSKEDYKPATIKSYVTSIFNVARRFGHNEIPTSKIGEWFNYDKFFKIYADVKPMTRRNYISAVIALLKVRGEEKSPLFEKLSEYRDTLTNEYERIVEKKELTPSEQAKWVDYDDLKGVYSKVTPFLERMGFFRKGGKPVKAENYDPKEIKKVRDHVFVALYSYPFHDPESNFGVLRNDLPSLYFTNGKKGSVPNDGKNYFRWCQGKGELIMRDYKTSKRYGESVIPLPKELGMILKKWTEFNGVGNKERLFPSCERHHVTNSLQSFFKKETGKPLSSQMLRKIYISGRFSKDHNDQEETAKSMMHNVETQQSVYSKKVGKK